MLFVLVGCGREIDEGGRPRERPRSEANRRARRWLLLCRRKSIGCARGELENTEGTAHAVHAHLKRSEDIGTLRSAHAASDAVKRTELRACDASRAEVPSEAAAAELAGERLAARERFTQLGHQML